MDLSTCTPAQKESIQHLDGPLLICAGAGSGKTFTLTQRIAYALLPGSGTEDTPFLNSIDEALVITFTEKAAAEIKDRIRATLRAEGMLEESLKVDSAWISTIHGMCSRILREHALEIGLDPSFKVLSATQEEELRMMAIERVLAQTEEEGLYRTLFSQLQAEDVKQALEKILQKAHTLSCGLDAIVLSPEGESITALARKTLELAQNPAEGGTETFYSGAAVLAEQIQESMEQNWENIEQLKIDLRPFACAQAKELKAAATELRQALLVVPYRESTTLLVQLAKNVEAAYEAELMRQGCIDMSGLIRRTLAVFNEFPEIAAQYTNRFQLIMVDEFQDTSQLQIDMIEYIAGASRARLCTVGDAQQSIYRFQGADVSVYLQHKKDMEQSGAELVQLDTNFRSNADVLAFVRKVCGQDGFFPEKFLDLQAGSAGKPYFGKTPRIEVALSPYNSQRKTNPIKAASARAAEAQFFAQRFKEFHDAGHNYSDMVLLLGRMTSAQQYAHAFHSANIPCVVTGGSKYFESTHVKTCLALLGTLANPYDSGNLLTVLTSDTLPVSTNDLLLLSTDVHTESGNPKRQILTKELVSSQQAIDGASPLLEHARAVLVRAWEKLGSVPPAQIFKETILESGWLGRLEAGDPISQAKAADILKFIHLLEEIQDETGFDMVRLHREMLNRSAASGEKPGALSVENLEAVRIMTIHSSKGLEFPIVAVADCYENSGQGSKTALLTENGLLYLSVSKTGSKDAFSSTDVPVDKTTDAASFHSSIICTNEEKEYAEKKRLFYVAATRASVALLVGVCVSQSAKGYPRLVEDIKEGLTPGEKDFPEQSTTLEYGGSSPLGFVRLEVTEESIDETSAEHPPTLSVPILHESHALPLVPTSLRKDFFSYSSLAAEKPPPKSVSAIDSLDEDVSVLASPVSDSDKATDFGSALHRACEWLALQPSEPTAEEIDAALTRAAKEFNVANIQRLEAAFSRWFTSSARMWARSFNTQQPELPFVVEKDGGILEGEIDLFCASGTRAGIIDYKTGGSAEETLEQLQEKHALQAECYAYAALQAGYTEVELRFVRVEQVDAEDPSQPQVVSYSFQQ